MTTSGPLRVHNFVDFAFCVDVSPSMEPHFTNIRRTITRQVTELSGRALDKGIHIDQVRARVIPFCSADFQPPATDFFPLSPAVGRLRGKSLKSNARFLEALEAATRVIATDSGTPHSLRALETAFRSQWVQEEGKRLHITVVFTDFESAQPAESSRVNHPGLEASTLSHLHYLTDLWEECNGTAMFYPGRRLMLFAPDVYPWNVIGDEWAQTCFLPSRAGEDLSDVEMETIFEVLLNSW